MIASIGYKNGYITYNFADGSSTGKIKTDDRFMQIFGFLTVPEFLTFANSGNQMFRSNRRG